MKMAVYESPSIEATGVSDNRNSFFQGKVYMIKRLWERHYPDGLLNKEAPAEKHLERVHCWGGSRIRLQVAAGVVRRAGQFQ